VKRSAGLLLYRLRGDDLEVLIAHPGGPLWASRDEGAWSLVKGEVEPGEASLEVARREFLEETGLEPPAGEPIELGEVRQKSGKHIEAWALEGDLDPDATTSMTFSMEWPPRSGRQQEFPEIDRVAWVPPGTARRRLNPAQAELVDRLIKRLGRGDPGGSGRSEAPQARGRSALG
jgi:predicted NUDIX family NTP pyrophosphohydrolase